MDCSSPGSSLHGFSRQEYWSGLSSPSPGDLPHPGIELGSPALQADSLVWAIREAPLGTYLATFCKSDVVKMVFPRRRERGGKEINISLATLGLILRWWCFYDNLPLLADGLLVVLLCASVTCSVWLGWLCFLYKVLNTRGSKAGLLSCESLNILQTQEFSSPVSLNDRRNGEIPELAHPLGTPKLWVRGIWKWAKNGGLLDIPPQGRQKVREFVPAWFLGVLVES